MKILLFVDTHDRKDVIKNLKSKAKQCEFAICAGDFTFFGEDQYRIMEEINSLNLPIYLVHGNHEYEDETRFLCEEFENIEFIHDKAITVKDILLIGHGGGGFNPRYPDFEKRSKEFGKKVKQAKKSILITHAPPFNTTIDETRPGNHVGSTTYKDFIKKYQPTLSVAGHIHQTAEKTGNIDKTTVINPGWKGYTIDL